MPKEIQMNQNCAEVMFIKAAGLVMNQNLNFQYDEEIPDVQVDLGPAFMLSPDEEKKMWHSGKKKETLEADLNKLDKGKVYFLRTGANGGAGHWQNLFFDNKKNGWMVYSNEANNYQLTENNILTEQGKDLLAIHATWGPANGQYAFLIVEASKQNLINGVNYLYDFRTLGADAAMMNAFDQKADFYQRIKAPADAQINQVDEQQEMILNIDFPVLQNPIEVDLNNLDFFKTELGDNPAKNTLDIEEFIADLDRPSIEELFEYVISLTKELVDSREIAEKRTNQVFYLAAVLNNKKWLRPEYFNAVTAEFLFTGDKYSASIQRLFATTKHQSLNEAVGNQPALLIQRNNIIQLNEYQKIQLLQYNADYDASADAFFHNSSPELAKLVIEEALLRAQGENDPANKRKAINQVHCLCASAYVKELITVKEGREWDEALNLAGLGFNQFTGGRQSPNIAAYRQAINEQDLEQQRQAEHQRIAEQQAERINNILNGLQNRIDQIEQHNFPDAVDAATELLRDLEACRDKYIESFLRQPSIAGQTAAKEQYNCDCNIAIDKAKPILEKDLGWEDYLKNLLKSLVNTIIWATTLGNSNSFFSYKKPASLEAVVEAEENLKLI